MYPGTHGISPGYPAVYYLGTPTVYYPGIYIYPIYRGMYHVPGYPRYITRINLQYIAWGILPH